MNKLLIGCDPGVNGCIVLINANTLEIIDHMMLRDYIIEPNKLIRFCDFYIYNRIKEIINYHGYNDIHITIEGVGFYKQYQAMAAIKLARVAASLETMFYGITENVTWLTPRTWQKKFRIYNKSDAFRCSYTKDLPVLREYNDTESWITIAESYLIGIYNEI